MLLRVEYYENVHTLKAYKVQTVERWIVCTPLSVNVFVTLTTL
jgi:hypothetical protein